MSTRRMVIIFSCLAIATSGGWWWQQAGNRQAIVAGALPPMPDLGAAPPVLRERIGTAEKRARARATAAKGLVELSRLYHANGFLDEAVRCYGGLERLAPSEARWRHLHATILAGFGEIESAAGLWRQAVEFAPHYVPAQLRLGDCLLKANRSLEAATMYSNVLKQNPDNSYALLGLARIDLEAKHWDQARERLETVVSQTNYNLGYDLIVNLYEQIGENARANAIRGSAKASGAYRDPPDPWLDELVDLCFDPYRLSLEAGTVARFGEPAKAILLLQRAIDLAPEDVAPHFQLGCLGESQHNFQLAREQLELCTTLAPEFADGWAHLSALHADAGNGAAAERTLAAGLSRCPASPGLHLMRARRLRQAGRADEAINEFLESIRLRPNEPEAYVEVGSIYAEMGRINEGIQKMQEALEADPGDPMALGILAFQSITTGRETDSRRWLARVTHQPRVPREQAARLLEAYRQAFGRDWVPDKSND